MSMLALKTAAGVIWGVTGSLPWERESTGGRTVSQPNPRLSLAR